MGNKKKRVLVINKGEENQLNKEKEGKFNKNKFTKFEKEKNYKRRNGSGKEY